VTATYNGWNWLSASDYATPERCPNGTTVSWTATYSSGAVISGTAWVVPGGVTYVRPVLGDTISFSYYFPASGGCARGLGW
jgi:hypothetical protein